MAKKSLQDKANFVDNVVTDKGSFMLSTKTVKYIIGLLIVGTLSILGTSWGFKASLENTMTEMKTSIENKIEKVRIDLTTRIEALEKEDVKPNTKKNYEQDGTIGILLDRTNSRDESVNRNRERPDNISQPPPPIMNGDEN